MSECRLCPRQCGIDRTKIRGICRSPEEVMVARAAPHFGEEPCISGEKGSGAVFFAGCPMGCVFCQNYKLSRARQGKKISAHQLAGIFQRLEQKGVHNLNLVTGTSYAPQIVDALDEAKPRIPVVWNSSGYETQETLRLLENKVQIYLPDMKYALAAPAMKYSKASDYPRAAAAAIREMVRQTGPFQIREDGIMERGVIIRHLVLPEQLENTRRVIDWVAETFSPSEVLFSLMAQYTPCGQAAEHPEINRTLTKEEWETAQEYLQDSGIENGFVQELSASGEEEIPDFESGEGVF